MHATSQMFAFASKYLEFEKEIRSLAPISQQKSKQLNMNLVWSNHTCVTVPNHLDVFFNTYEIQLLPLPYV